MTASSHSRAASERRLSVGRGRHRRSAGIGAAVLFAPAASATRFTVTDDCNDDGDDECTLREAVDDGERRQPAPTRSPSSRASRDDHARRRRRAAIVDGQQTATRRSRVRAPTRSRSRADDLYRIFKILRFNDPDVDVTFSGLTLSDGEGLGRRRGLTPALTTPARTPAHELCRRSRSATSVLTDQLRDSSAARSAASPVTYPDPDGLLRHGDRPISPGDGAVTLTNSQVDRQPAPRPAPASARSRSTATSRSTDSQLTGNDGREPRRRRRLMNARYGDAEPDRLHGRDNNAEYTGSGDGGG